jgi:hypothetical protein
VTRRKKIEIVAEITHGAADDSAAGPPTYFSIAVGVRPIMLTVLGQLAELNGS